MACAGHGVAMPPRPSLCPDNTCWLCHLPFPPPFVPPPSPSCPPSFSAGAYVDGVLRSSSGHITGIAWDELRGANAGLARFKDVAIGPGHPLAEGMNPRSFIPGVARGPAPSPVRPVSAAARAAVAPPRGAPAADAAGAGADEAPAAGGGT